MYTTGQYYKNKINAGRSELVGSSYTYSSSYDEGEGWSSGDIGTNVSVTYNITTLRQYTGAGAPDPLVTINAAGNAVNARNFRVRLNGDSILGVQMDYYNYSKTSKTVPLSSISTGNANFQVTNLCAVSGDRMVIGKIEFTYARLFHFGGAANFYFELPANAIGNYLEISGFTASGSVPVLYDLTNGKRYVTDNSNTALLKVLLQPSSVDRQLVLVSEAPANIKTISTLQSRNFVDYSLQANQGDYLIISNALLTGATAGGDPVDEYRAYRSSGPGGGYNANVYMIDQLEDQFGFWHKKASIVDPKFFEVGKSKIRQPSKECIAYWQRGYLYAIHHRTK